MVERVLRKDEAKGSIPLISILFCIVFVFYFFDVFFKIFFAFLSPAHSERSRVVWSDVHDSGLRTVLRCMKSC